MKLHEYMEAAATSRTDGELRELRELAVTDPDLSGQGQQQLDRALNFRLTQLARKRGGK